MDKRKPSRKGQMSSPTPAPKRRKTSALFKPFKSPLRTPLPANSNSALPPQSSAPGTTIAKHPQQLSPLSTTTTSSTAPPTTLSPADKPPQSNPPTASRNPSLPPLQTHHTTLAHTHTHLLSTLDTHTQALKIESSAQDAELARLTTLWRLAARQAAEELFAGVRDRVNRMGGVGAWRQREREGRERWGGGGGGWDDGGEKRGGGEQEGEEEEEGVEERREREGGGERDRVEERSGWEGGDDDGFTMDMMLQSLSIDLGVIGYDKEMQRWID
ncbi:hypothetical protein MMC26_000464 [Xylographa opegraphella]|nr:hypothetical protein [Xylographa opegraphella]